MKYNIGAIGGDNEKSDLNSVAIEVNPEEEQFFMSEREQKLYELRTRAIITGSMKEQKINKKSYTKKKRKRG